MLVPAKSTKLTNGVAPACIVVAAMSLVSASDLAGALLPGSEPFDVSSRQPASPSGSTGISMKSVSRIFQIDDFFTLSSPRHDASRPQRCEVHSGITPRLQDKPSVRFSWFQEVRRRDDKASAMACCPPFDATWSSRAEHVARRASMTGFPHSGTPAAPLAGKATGVSGCAAAGGEPVLELMDVPDLDEGQSFPALPDCPARRSDDDTAVAALALDTQGIQPGVTDCGKALDALADG